MYKIQSFNVLRGRSAFFFFDKRTSTKRTFCTRSSYVHKNGETFRFFHALKSPFFGTYTSRPPLRTFCLQEKKNDENGER